MLFKLFGPKIEALCEIVDEVYLSERAKNRAIVNYAKENDSTICITWFAETTTLFRSLFTASGLDETRVVEAKFFNAQKYPGKILFCAEHYPLPGKEDELIANLQQKDIKVYCAITDPLFKVFGGDKIVELMSRMGMQEDEMLTNQMISKSIRRAQAKLAESISLESSATSQEQWFMRNHSGKAL